MSTTPEAGMASLFRNLEEKTGKSIDDWVVIARGSGAVKHGQIVAFLKQEHALTHGYAHQIALRAAASGESTKLKPGDDIDAQYAGPKAGLRPIYDALAASIRAFGPDVELSPKKTYVSLRRSKQF